MFERGLNVMQWKLTMRLQEELDMEKWRFLLLQRSHKALNLNNRQRRE